MRVLQINSIYPIKSTGRIVKELTEIHKSHGIESFVACGFTDVKEENVYVIGTPLYNKLSIAFTRFFGKHGFYNKCATRKLLRYIDSIKPDIIHLHNIHGHYLNVRLLFEYIKKHNIPVVWTLHDCWSFTGHCAYFDVVNCDKWKTGCHNCPAKHQYPVTKIFDRSKESYKDKKKLFCGVDNLHIATASAWLAEKCKESFLKDYPITVAINGIDTDKFAPVENDLKKSLGIEDKFVLLGIISDFASHKGGADFLKLSEMLKDDEVIVLLSLEEEASQIPSNIIPVPRTSDDTQIAAIYSMADVFVNPTMQETFGMVNLEAIACKTPVVTYKTGGAAESQTEKTGFTVPRGDVNAMYDAIQRVKNGEIDPEACRERALNFKKQDCYLKYIEIYRKLSDK